MPAVDRISSEATASQTKKRARKQPSFSNSRLFMQRVLSSSRFLSTYAKAHRARFVHGTLFSILLVAIRVAMPWPLQALIKPWLAGGQAGGEAANLALFGWHPAVFVGIIYAVLITVLGFADYRLRFNFARFAIGVVRDIRTAVINGIGQIRRLDPNRTSGDLVTRLIGDSARLKAGLKGFLVHVATNGLLFVGISGVLLWMEWRIGFIFLIASLLTVVLTLRGASQIFSRSLKYRRKESKMAHTIAERLILQQNQEDEDEDDADDPSLEANHSSGKYEASITRIQGRTTWAAHLVLAIAIPAALWQSYRAVSTGLINPGELFIVMLYALMILGPMVRLARQGTRCGKILANAQRLRKLLKPTTSGMSDDGPLYSNLREGISMENLRLQSNAKGTKRRWFGPLTLRLEAGQKVAVIGDPGSGKSTLLSILAGREPYKGSATWDDREFRELNADSLSEHVAYIAQIPTWSSLEASEVIDSTVNAKPGDPRSALWKWSGLRPFRSQLKKRGDERILSEEVSHSACKVLALMRYRQSSHSLKLVDDPVGDIRSNRAAKKYLSAFLAAQGREQLVIVALDRPVALNRFDRVIALKKNGRLAFDGSPADWRVFRSTTATKPPAANPAPPSI